MFKGLFGRKNPSADWQPYAGWELTFDLGAGRLNDAQIGQPLELVSFLGPDEDKKAYRQGHLHYYSLGLSVGFEGPDAVLSDFSLVFRDPDERRFDPFPGRVVFEGKTIDPSSLTAENCESILGECYWRDEDDGETILFYELPGLEWQVEFDASGLTCLLVTDTPLLARADQRQAYGVTKPWPPETAG